MTPQIIESHLIFFDKIIYVKQWLVENSQAAPIILIHESLGNVALWKDFPEKLARITQRNVIAYDRLGFGQSSKMDRPLTLNFITDEVETIIPELLKKLNIQIFIALGHSVGGGMAAICAALYPQNCKAAITISAQSIVEEVTLDGIRQAKINFKNEKLFNRLAQYHDDKTQWVLDAWTETWLSPDFATWNLDPYIQNIHCPLLVIHGENDEYATLVQPERFINYATSTQKSLKILKDCGHFPHKEKEQEVLHIIYQFLKLSLIP